MASDPTVQELLERNKHYAVDASPIPFLSETPKLGLTFPHILVVTCCDPRCHPEQFLDLKPFEAVVMRNMCGHAAPVLNGILALDHLINFTDIMVIHHTDCGSLAFTDDQVRESLRARQPDDKTIDSRDFGTITDLKKSVRDDLAIIKGSPLMRKELADRSYGFIYDITSGLVSPVED